MNNRKAAILKEKAANAAIIVAAVLAIGAVGRMDYQDELLGKCSGRTESSYQR